MTELERKLWRALVAVTEELEGRRRYYDDGPSGATLLDVERIAARRAELTAGERAQLRVPLPAGRA